jgi:hypothetical protein
MPPPVRNRNTITEQTFEILDHLSDTSHATGVRRLPLHMLVLTGRAVHTRSIVGSANDAQALRRLENRVRPALGLRPDRPYVPDELDDLDRVDIANAFWAGKWCGCGFPRLRLRAARAALLAATCIPGDLVGDVRPPWPAFLINLEGEEQLLADPDRPGVFYDQIEVLYSDATGRPTWTFFRRSPTCENYSRLWTTPEEWGSDLDSLRLFDRDEIDPQSRIFQVVSRIVLGLCLHLSMPGVQEAASTRAKSKRFRRDRSGPPQMTNFVLGNDVKVDFSRAIRDYICRGGRAVTVQSMVRGHWKRQAHGPGHSLRKLIHIEPYWRGPEGAPVLVRAHDVV